MFRRFRQAKFDNSSSILSSSQFLLLLQLPQKIKLAFKVVKIDLNNQLTDNDLTTVVSKVYLQSKKVPRF